MNEQAGGGDVGVECRAGEGRVLLLGASGFIGSHVLAALSQSGREVVAVCRRPPRRRPALDAVDVGKVHWRIMGMQGATDPRHWTPWLQGVDVVINCIGILRQRVGQTYDDVHHRMPAALAVSCARQGVRLIHTSALGLHENARSRFLSSKLQGERAVAASGADHCIVRPSLIDGRGGFGAGWLRTLASVPVHFVPRGAQGRFAAVHASDLGEAYAALAARRSLSDWREVELGGEQHYRFGEYLQLLRGAHAPDGNRSPAWQVPIPDWLTRVGSHLCDALRFSPFSFGHWILLQRDNLPRPNALPVLLQRAPRRITHAMDHRMDDLRLS